MSRTKRHWKIFEQRNAFSLLGTSSSWLAKLGQIQSGGATKPRWPVRHRVYWNGTTKKKRTQTTTRVSKLLQNKSLISINLHFRQQSWNQGNPRGTMIISLLQRLPFKLSRITFIDTCNESPRRGMFSKRGEAAVGFLCTILSGILLTCSRKLTGSINVHIEARSTAWLGTNWQVLKLTMMYVASVILSKRGIFWYKIASTLGFKTEMCRKLGVTDEVFHYKSPTLPPKKKKKKKTWQRSYGQRLLTFECYETVSEKKKKKKRVQIVNPVSTIQWQQ